MKEKLNLALKIIILVLISVALIFYILATASDHWQETTYNVGFHTVGVFTRNAPNDLYRYTSSYSGLWRGCALLNNKKFCANMRVQHGKCTGIYYSYTNVHIDSDKMAIK